MPLTLCALSPGRREALLACDCTGITEPCNARPKHTPTAEGSWTHSLTHTQTHTLAWGPEIHKNKQFLYFTFKGNIIVTLTYLRCCHICMGSVTWDKTSLLRNTIGNAFGLFFMMLIFCLIFFVFVVIQKYLKIKFQWFSKLKIWYVLI